MLRTESITLDSLTADPAAPAEGQIWFNSTDGVVRTREDGVTKSLTGVTSDSVSDEVQDDIASGDGVTLVDSMTRTPGAGNYLVWFDCSCLLVNNYSEAQFSIFINGVEQTRSRRQAARSGPQTAGIVYPFSLHARVTNVLAAQAIEVRASVDVGTVSIYERTLSWLRVA